MYEFLGKSNEMASSTQEGDGLSVQTWQLWGEEVKIDSLSNYWCFANTFMQAAAAIQQTLDPDVAMLVVGCIMESRLLTVCVLSTKFYSIKKLWNLFMLVSSDWETSGLMPHSRFELWPILQLLFSSNIYADSDRDISQLPVIY